MTTHALFSLIFTPSGQQGPGTGMFVVQILLFIAIFYFLIIRPQRVQQKKHKALLGSLQKGDHVVTSGGIVGEVIHLRENEVTIRTGEARLVVVRSSIAHITNRGAAAEPEKK